MTALGSIELQVFRSRLGDGSNSEPTNADAASEVAATEGYQRSPNDSDISPFELDNSSATQATNGSSPGQSAYEGSLYYLTPPNSTRVSSSEDPMPNNDSHLVVAAYSRHPLAAHFEYEMARRRQSVVFMEKFCYALRAYGTPPHRIPEILNITSRALELDMDAQQFLTHTILHFHNREFDTTQTRVVNIFPRFNLGRMSRVQEIFTSVRHGRESPANAIDLLDGLATTEPPECRWFPRWLGRYYQGFITTKTILFYGLSCAFVGPFAFKAGKRDTFIIFLLGTPVTMLQTLLVPDNYALVPVNGFFSAFITSFSARMISTSRHGHLFCYSAIAESSVALLLPGYQFLCAALEIEHAHFDTGAIRMAYAIFSCFSLSVGMTLGAAVSGYLSQDAPDQLECSNPQGDVATLPWAAAFTVTLIFLNRAGFKQIPWMCTIAVASHTVMFFGNRRFKENSQVSNVLSAFVIGVLGNGGARLSSRFKRLSKYLGTPAASMLPALFLLVPSGIAITGSLKISLRVAEDIVTGRNGVPHASEFFIVALEMVWIVFGLTIGLLVAMFVVYPVQSGPKARFTL